MLRKPIILIYSRTSEKLTFSTKIKVFGNDTMIFMDQVIPENITRSVKKRFYSDAFEAGKKFYDDLQSKG